MRSSSIAAGRDRNPMMGSSSKFSPWIGGAAVGASFAVLRWFRGELSLSTLLDALVLGFVFVAIVYMQRRSERRKNETGE
jgi:hypothetical protein